MSGSLYLREWSAAVRRASNKTPDLFAEHGRKQRTIFGIRRTLRKIGAELSVDLERLNEQELDQVRVEIAGQFRRKQRGESAPPPASPQNRENTPQNT